jgi:hypothetical protein
MAQRWGNWAKVFFNNKGVVAGRPITAPTTRLVIRRCERVSNCREGS